MQQYFGIASPLNIFVCAGDGFSGSQPKYSLKGMRFSTLDKDHDLYKYNCAEIYHAGWWFNRCTGANLNGYRYLNTYEGIRSVEGIVWVPWRQWSSLKAVKMMVRRSLVRP